MSVARKSGERFARIVTRAFYDDVHVVVFDALLAETTQPAPDTEIADHIGLPGKVVRTTLQKLKRDGFVLEHTQRQAASSKKATIFLWSFDHERFARVFRYRMLRLRRASNVKSNASLPEESFYCNNAPCYQMGKRFTMIEVVMAARQAGLTEFRCELCQTVLTKDVDVAASSGAAHQDLKVRLNVQLAEIERLSNELAKLILQEKKDAAAAELAAASGNEVVQQIGTSALTGTEQVSVIIEGASNNVPVAAKAARVTPSHARLPWEAASQSNVPDLGNAVPVVQEPVVSYEEILARQHEQLSSSLPVTPAPVKPHRAPSPSRGHKRQTPQEAKTYVSVNGVQMALDEVTEAHCNTMTEEEYQIYSSLVDGNEDDFDDEF